MEEGKNRAILIVDAQRFVRDVVKDYLSETKLSILEASDGVEAIRAFVNSLEKIDEEWKSPLNLIILDLSMPGLIDGEQVLGLVNAINNEIPVVVLTASPPTEALLERLKPLGAKRYLHKTAPNIKELLLKAVEELST